MTTTVGAAVLEAESLRRRLRRIGRELALALEGALVGVELADPLALADDLATTCAELGKLEGAIIQGLAGGRLPGGRSPGEVAAELRALALGQRALEAAVGLGARRGLVGGGGRLALAALEARVEQLARERLELEALLGEYCWTSALPG